MASSVTTVTSPAHSTTSSNLAATEPPQTAPAPNASHHPLSPPTTPTYPTPDAKVAHYTPPPHPPRFPRHPCPTPHHTLSLLASEHEAQRLFGPDFSLRSAQTGELRGPFALLSYTDAWIPKYCRYIHSVMASPVFSRRERELIGQAVLGATKAGWVWEEMGGRDGEAGAEVVEEVGELSKRERNVSRLAREMVQRWGRVAGRTWEQVVVRGREGDKGRGVERWLEGGMDGDVEVGGEMSGAAAAAAAEERLTKAEVATLAQIVASVMFVSVLVNCAEGEMAEGEDEFVQQP